MADKKITELTTYSPPVDNDVLPIVDTTLGVTMKITWANIKAALKTYFDSLTTTLTNKTLTSPVLNTSFTGTAKATGAEINTGTEDAKIVTPKAIADSNVSYTDGTETLTNKTLTSPLFQGTVNGWVSANETWTRESDNSFSEPIDATLKYQKGDKLRYKQGGGWKYQYVASIGAYSGGKTIIATTGGSGYVFTNGTAITDNYYSHQESPVGFPAYFDYTPTITTTGGSITTSQNAFRFYIKGSIVFIPRGSFSFSASTGTGQVLITLPVAASDSEYIFCGGASDNTSLSVRASSSTVIAVNKYDGTSIAGVTGTYWKIN